MGPSPPHPARNSRTGCSTSLRLQSGTASPAGASCPARRQSSRSRLAALFLSPEPTEPLPLRAPCRPFSIKAPNNAGAAQAAPQQHAAGMLGRAKSAEHRSSRLERRGRDPLSTTPHRDLSLQGLPNRAKREEKPRAKRKAKPRSPGAQPHRSSSPALRRTRQSDSIGMEIAKQAERRISLLNGKREGS